MRFVQLYASTWDSHDYIAGAHGSLIRSVDRPIAGLLKDLKQRGLLDDTLVIAMGEFGRTPKINDREGRDHYPKAYSQLIAGGGIRGGQVHEIDAATRT